MKRQKSKVFFTAMAGICAFILFAQTGFVRADEKDETINALLDRISNLERKVDEMNKKMEINKSVETAGFSEEVIHRKIEHVLAQKEQTEGGLLKAVKDINVSGFVDTSFTNNLQNPDTSSATSGGGANVARVFDTEANNFNVRAAEMVFEKLTPDEGGAGFRTDLYFGSDAEVITPNGSARDQFDLEQAYIQLKPDGFKLPIGNWQWLKLGKFVTMHGSEVIEAKDNWNFSRGLLFGYAIPFTHTGIRAGYQLTDSLAGYLGVNNGWDNVKDNNRGKSLEAALGLTASDKLSFNLAGMYGPEQTTNNHSQRALIDFITTYKLHPKLTFMLNADYAHEEDGVTAGKDAEWSGVAAYLKYDLSEKISLVNRTEFFSDPQGLRLTAGNPQDIWETTFTFEVRPYKNLITRLEYRYDESSSNIFSPHTPPKSGDHQDTIALQAIYSF
ncbi:MAG: porin [Candidatus Omnitrophota bacterium]